MLSAKSTPLLQQTGMKEDVGFVGNDYTTAGQLFTAGYIIGQLPCALALSSGRIRPRVFFPAMAACWGILTLGLAFVNDVKAVFIIRFFQAIFEASTFAGSHYLLGSWYTAEELVRRRNRGNQIEGHLSNAALPVSTSGQALSHLYQRGFRRHLILRYHARRDTRDA